ncbi:MAG TPA: hypothetical protein VGR21_07505, partial [Cryptosporangiaceae bacterium]|nr:hypothetical protein [Cryptosporangiaceae bacterium]
MWGGSRSRHRTGAPAAGTGRSDAAVRGRTIGQHDPLRLGVHRAIHADLGLPAGGELPTLTPYVARDHDTRLRDLLRTARGNQLVLLVGGSSTGKTRACYQAVLDVAPGSPVVVPASPEHLLELLAGGVGSGTVLWLDEAQRYFEPPHGQRVATALRQLLTARRVAGGRRVLVVGSMWLAPYWLELTRAPEEDDRDGQPAVRDLLTASCTRVDVAEDFQTLTPVQRETLERLAGKDPRLRAAVHTGADARVTQVLAGGPLLLHRHRDLESTRPAAHAVLNAAMDAYRIGYRSPLPEALLRQAATGYLATPIPAGDLPDALAHAARAEHG